MADQHGGKFSIIPARVYDDPGVDLAALRVLGLIGCYSDRGGWCYLSLAKLGLRVSLTKQAIAKQIGTLVRLGYLEKRAAFRENGSQTANRYRIIFDTNSAEFEPSEMFDTTEDDSQEVDGGSTSKGSPPLNFEVHPRTTYSNVSTKNVIPPISPMGEKCAQDYEPEKFDLFWRDYPRKTAKLNARKSWNKLRPDEATRIKMRAALHNCANSEQWERGIIPHAATWINQRRWEDDTETQAHQ